MYVTQSAGDNIKKENTAVCSERVDSYDAGDYQDTVEVMNINTKQWSTAC